MAEKSTVSVGPWPKGIDNRSPAYAIPEDAVRNAVNVDFLRDGRVRRREGYTKISSFVGAHSLWACELGLYFAVRDTLYFSDGTVHTPVFSGLQGARVAYEYFNGDVFFTDNIQCKRLIAGSTVADWGIDPPAKPAVNIIGGSLSPGTYSFAAVAVNPLTNELSAPSEVETITSNVACGFDVSANTGLVYVTPNNSSSFYLPASTIITSEAQLGSGALLNITPLAKPIPSEIIRYHAGRFFFVSGNIVWFTNPFSLVHVDLQKNYWQFTEAVSVFEPVDEGFWVVADKTYFFKGRDTDDVSVNTVFDYGAVKYTSARMLNNSGVLWQSVRGTIMADNSGQAKNIQEANVFPDTATDGTTVLRERDGETQFVFIAGARTAGLSGLAAKDFFDAEIIRRGG